MMDVIHATNLLRLMLDGKHASLSILAHPGVNVHSDQLARATQDVWHLEAVLFQYKVHRDLRALHVGKRRDRSAT